MALIEIKSEIPVDEVERVDGLLLETESGAWNVLEEVLTGRAWVLGMFEGEASAEAAWLRLQAILPSGVTGEKQKRVVAEQDWSDGYKAHFKAWRFGPLHWVPVWEREGFELPEGEAVLWLDPGMAFGTGNHETTRLCVERLVAWAAHRRRDMRVVDAGCGSGILALSAAKLGFRDVVGFDNDAEAVRVSAENAALNGLANTVSFATEGLAGGLAGRQADLLLANILAHLLEAHARELTEAVAPGGLLVLSGILAKEVERVRGVFCGLAPDWRCESAVLGEWADLALTRPR